MDCASKCLGNSVCSAFQWNKLDQVCQLGKRPKLTTSVSQDSTAIHFDMDYNEAALGRYLRNFISLTYLPIVDWIQFHSRKFVPG